MELGGGFEEALETALEKRLGEGLESVCFSRGCGTLAATAT
jgi:hypothetical protein